MAWLNPLARLGGFASYYRTAPNRQITYDVDLGLRGVMQGITVQNLVGWWLWVEDWVYLRIAAQGAIVRWWIWMCGLARSHDQGGWVMGVAGEANGAIVGI